MEIQNKIPVNLGLFGHIDSGKTAVAKAISEIISTAGIDAHPQSKERGITIDLGFTSFIIDDYLVNLVDGPGHADLIKISASSVEIIDCALIVIDINKGPQIQTGEHLVMIESLGINSILVILNKIDLFKGDIQKEIEKTRRFFGTTSFSSNVSIYPVSAKNKAGFENLKEGILETINSLDIQRDLKREVIIPIDHYFTVKGRGTVFTGTILQGVLQQKDDLEILPIKDSGIVKNIQTFHQNVQKAKAGSRVGVNIKNIDIDKLYRGCYATTDSNLFDYCDIIEIKVNKSKLFKPEVNFGTQIHLTIGMTTITGNIYPYYEKDRKRIQTSVPQKETEFKAICLLKEYSLIRKRNNTMLLSRLDLPPTTLRIIGSADLLKIHEKVPLFYKYKIKKGKVKYPSHTEGIVCTDLAQSYEGAKKIVGKDLESPFTKIIGTFGTKGAVIVGIDNKDLPINKGDSVILKELRSFQLKKI